MTLQTWIIEPRDSLIVRDGKPFGANITHATSLDFPFPSTTNNGTIKSFGESVNLPKLFMSNSFVCAFHDSIDDNFIF